MEKKNILIVGASSGIGYQLAQKLLLKGVTLFSASRTAPTLPPSVTHLTWDAAKPDSLIFGQLPSVLHGVVYCPGSIALKPFNRFSINDFQNDFQLNVLGAIQILQGTFPALKKANGASVVLFSTVAVQLGMGFHSSIAASKGAVEGLTRSLAAEWATAKIRVNALAPSLTDTPLAKQLLSTDEKREASNKRHPLGRIGTPEDIASAAAFLLSEEATWLTGQIIGVDGGMSSIKMI
jgi:NAD(P)-dependent dehydrogenase (short-subunit alcohol dehydrogenase family)